MYIFTPNMSFLCLTMWLGGLYTDNDNETNTDADANTNTDSETDPNNDRQSRIV